MIQVSHIDSKIIWGFKWMGLFNKYSISILLVTIGSLANAELFNYDYVDLKAGTTSSKAGDREYSLEVS